MSEEPGSYAAETAPLRAAESAPRLRGLAARRERMVEEIRRNRAGEARTPTWVLAVILVALLAAWAALIIFA